MATMTTYYNPGGHMGNPMNFGNTPGVYKNPGGLMGNPINMPQPWQQQAAAAVAPPDPAQLQRQKVFDEYQKQLDAFNKDNESRYQSGLDLQKEAYARSLGEFAQGGPQYGVSLNKWGAGDLSSDSPLWSPQAAAINADAVSSGLSTSASTNDKVVSNSMALAGLNQQQFANRQSLLSAANQAGGNLANYYVNAKTNTPPDFNQLAQLAAMEGQGTTDNMSAPPIASGGFGGVPNYFVPQQAWGMPVNNAYAAPPQKWKQDAWWRGNERRGGLSKQSYMLQQAAQARSAANADQGITLSIR